MIDGARKPLIFISDLHLQDKSPELTNALVSFLAEQSGSCGALYILETYLRFGWETMTVVAV